LIAVGVMVPRHDRPTVSIVNGFLGLLVLLELLDAEDDEEESGASTGGSATLDAF